MRRIVVKKPKLAFDAYTTSGGNELINRATFTGDKIPTSGDPAKIELNWMHLSNHTFNTSKVAWQVQDVYSSVYDLYTVQTHYYIFVGIRSGTDYQVYPLDTFVVKLIHGIDLNRAQDQIVSDTKTQFIFQNAEGISIWGNSKYSAIVGLHDVLEGIPVAFITFRASDGTPTSKDRYLVQCIGSGIRTADYTELAATQAGTRRLSWDIAIEQPRHRKDRSPVGWIAVHPERYTTVLVCGETIDQNTGEIISWVLDNSIEAELVEDAIEQFDTLIGGGGIDVNRLTPVALNLQRDLWFPYKILPGMFTPDYPPPGLGNTTGNQKSPRKDVNNKKSTKQAASATALENKLDINGTGSATSEAALNLKVLADGTQKWVDVGGRLHKGDGPAVIYSNKDEEWWWRGVYLGTYSDNYSQEKFNRFKGVASKVSWQIDQSNWVAQEIDGDGNIRYVNSEGELHRLDGPAAEWVDGETWWYQRGRRHRLDGPAIEYVNGVKRWYINGDFIGSNSAGFTAEDFENYKRENGITASKIAWQIHEDSIPILDDYGAYRWYSSEGLYHREGGPAVIFPDSSGGIREWYKNGVIHRIDGPAITHNDGYKAWWLEGQLIGMSTEGFTDADFEAYKHENGITAKLKNVLGWDVQMESRTVMTYIIIDELDELDENRILGRDIVPPVILRPKPLEIGTVGLSQTARVVTDFVNNFVNNLFKEYGTNEAWGDISIEDWLVAEYSNPDSPHNILWHTRIQDIPRRIQDIPRAEDSSSTDCLFIYVYPVTGPSRRVIKILCGVAKNGKAAENLVSAYTSALYNYEIIDV